MLGHRISTEQYQFRKKLMKKNIQLDFKHCLQQTQTLRFQKQTFEFSLCNGMKKAVMKKLGHEETKRNKPIGSSNIKHSSNITAWTFKDSSAVFVPHLKCFSKYCSKLCCFRNEPIQANVFHLYKKDYLEQPKLKDDLEEHNIYRPVSITTCY